MPSIYFEGPLMNVDQKRKIAKAFSEVASETTGIPVTSISVIFRANGSENVAVGGELLIDKNKK